MNRKWTAEEANEWYSKLGWLRGCNFIGSDCANRIDQWQSFGAQSHLATADRELALAEKIGFNTVRLIVEFDVWLQERGHFMQMLENYISLCAKHRQKVLLVLTTETQLTRGDRFIPKPLGEQFYALGYHQGRLPLTPDELALTPYHPLERAECRDKVLEMVSEIVRRYSTDERILAWNVYNEPGIVLGDRAIPLLRMLFDAVRAENPAQPLTADLWRGFVDGQPKMAAEREALALSDVVSWHCYSPLDKFVPELEIVQSFGRPILLTEWLHRINHSEVREIYPLLYLEKIACWCWGFVVGKTQTQEPWDAMWDAYDQNNGNVPYDFTRWQHDLFRPNGRPYDPKEIELIARYNRLAEERENTRA